MRAAFIESMLLARTERLPEGREWLYELSLTAIARLPSKPAGNSMFTRATTSTSRHGYPAIARALAPLPDETVIDGEVVAVDEDGRPSFHLLQNYGSSGLAFIYYVFDVLVVAGREVMRESLETRWPLLEEWVFAGLDEPIRCSPELAAGLKDLIQSVKAEGLVAKRRDSRYEPGQRSRAGQKMRFNQGQEFVIDGYTVGGTTFDALVFGYY
jgi:bifunctional non-homologous end joining protein LigD